MICNIEIQTMTLKQDLHMLMYFKFLQSKSKVIVLSTLLALAWVQRCPCRHNCGNDVSSCKSTLQHASSFSLTYASTLQQFNYTNKIDAQQEQSKQSARGKKPAKMCCTSSPADANEQYG